MTNSYQFFNCLYIRDIKKQSCICEAFQMPELPAKWRGVMNATQYSAILSLPQRFRTSTGIVISPKDNYSC
uniref:Uncharacterized protein n=1 Tax=Parascaris equorum TaxID=6256 RepID=A0A914R3N7_PAREQ